MKYFKHLLNVECKYSNAFKTQRYPILFVILENAS